MGICVSHAYILIGHSDTSLLLFLKGRVDKTSILMGYFNTLERSCCKMLLLYSKIAKAK